jgi:hypothetical protein
MKIVLEAITEFHEPKDYKFYPAIEIDVYELSGGSPNTETLLAHRCEDISGGVGTIDKDTALITARDYLGDNYKLIVQATISKIGE